MTQRPNWPWAARDAPTDVWTSEMISTIVSNTARESHENFPSPTMTDWKQKYHAEHYRRLVKLNTEDDPDIAFHKSTEHPPLPR